MQKIWYLKAQKKTKRLNESGVPESGVPKKPVLLFGVGIAGFAACLVGVEMLTRLPKEMPTF